MNKIVLTLALVFSMTACETMQRKTVVAQVTNSTGEKQDRVEVLYFHW